jgi:hypothetical protein
VPGKRISGIVKRAVVMDRKHFLGHLFELIATKKDMRILDLVNDCGEFKKSLKGKCSVTYICSE